MAAAIPAVISAIGSAIAAGGVASLTFFGLSGWQAFAAITAAFAALGAVSKALMGSPDLEAMRGINFNTRDPSSTRKLLYGKSRTGGTIVFVETSGNDNKYLHLIIAVAGHKVNALKEVYFAKEKVWDNGTYQDDWADYAQITFQDGTQTVAIPQLVLDVPEWTSNHKLLDTAYVYVRLAYDPEEYTNGVPNISFVIEGKSIYDPRKDSTSAVYDSSLGVSTHRPDTESTWQYSNNSALVLLDYMRDTKYGLGESLGAINLPALAGSADVCDEQVALSGSGTQKRYTCDGQIDTASSFSGNIENILSSMIGNCNYAAGQFFIEAYKYQAPSSAVIDETIMVSGLNVATKTSRRKLYNAVKGQFISEEENYVVTDYPAMKSAAYAADDGGTLFLDLILPMTNNNVRAQRIARLTMLKSRLQTAITFSVNLSGMRYKVGDNVKITNAKMGYVEKVFQITSYSLKPDPSSGLVVEMQAVENSSTAYDWLASDEEDFTNSGTVSLYDGKSTVPPTNLTLAGASATDADGTKESTITASWTASPDVFLENYIVKYKVTAESDYVLFYTDASPFKIPNVKPNTNYTVEVYAVNQLGNNSTAITATTTTAPDFVPRVPSIYRYSKTNSSAPTVSEFTAIAGRSPKDKDLVIATDTSGAVSAAHAWTYDLSSTAWVQDDNFISGDLIVAGSITGNEIKADSITVNKLSGDVSELFPVKALQETLLTTTLAFLQEFSIPAPELGISKRIRVDITNDYFFSKTGSTERNFTVQQYLQIKSKSATGVQVGANAGVTAVNFPFTFVQLIYLSGNHLGELDSTGAVADNSSGTSYGSIVGIWYDNTNDRTYLHVSTNAGFSTGDTLYYNPYNFAAVGTWISPAYIDQTDVNMTAATTGKRVILPVSRSFGSTTTATDLRFAAKISPAQSDVTARAKGFSGTTELVS